MEINHTLLAQLANYLIRIKRVIKKTRPLAHHGIQRSGTNYINECLKILSATPINAFNPKRNAYDHKHYRWQQDKKTIPSVLLANYGNEGFADSVFRINALAGFPRTTCHLVIKKNKDAWLLSVLNFGLASKWFTNKADALANSRCLLDDYDHYYTFWESMQAAHPNDVLVINIEDVYSEFSTLLSALDFLSVEYTNHQNFNGKINVVPMSPPDRKKIISVDDLNEYCEEAL